MQGSKILPSIEHAEHHEMSPLSGQTYSDQSWSYHDGDLSFGFTPANSPTWRNTNEDPRKNTYFPKASSQSHDAFSVKSPKPKRESANPRLSNIPDFAPVALGDERAWKRRLEEDGVCEIARDKIQSPKQSIQMKSMSANHQAQANDHGFGSNHASLDISHASAEPRATRQPKSCTGQAVSTMTTGDTPAKKTKLYRKEVDDPLRKSICDQVHPYFQTPGLKWPRLDRFGADEVDYAKCLKHIADCRHHNRALKNSCLSILKNQITLPLVCPLL